MDPPRELLAHPAEHVCFTIAALFDGHGTAAAAQRLNESLYSEFSHTIDDQMLNTFDDLEPCELNGALATQQSSFICFGHFASLSGRDPVTACKHLQSRTCS